MKHTPEEIKNRLSNIGEAIGNIALDYITDLEKENERLKGDLELWESGGCRATNLFECGVVKELKQQIDKLLDFVVERTEECDVCPLTDTCANSEGVCPYRNKRINLKEWILRHIESGTVQTETKQFLEYDKMPNCLGTQTTSGD